MNQPKAVIFDLFGTLCKNFTVDHWVSMHKQVAVILGADLEPWRKLWRSQMEKRSTGFFKTDAECLRYSCRRLGCVVDEAKIAEAVKHRRDFIVDILQPREDTLSTLVAINRSDLRIGLVSDCSQEVVEAWNDLPYKDYIDHPVFSCTAGIRKPDPAIYQIALDGLDVKAEDSLFVGDGGSFELTGATRIGMQAVILTQAGEPHVASDEYEGGSWSGAVINTISELLPMLGIEQ